MQKRYLSIATACLCLTTWLFLPGCGQNLFKGLDGDTAPSTAQEAAENGDYVTALSLSQTIIDAPDSSDPEKQEAYAQKGIALMGIHDISVLSLSKVLKDTGEENTVDTLSNLFQITPSDSEQIAEAFNIAYTLGGGQELGLTSLSATRLFSETPLNPNKQLLRGIANLTVVVKMATRVFNIATDGQVTLTDATESYEEAVTYLMGGSRTLFYYAENAIDGLTKADIFTDYQLEQAQKIRIVGLNLKNLYTAIQTNGTFTLQNYVNAAASAVTGDDAYSIVIAASGTAREQSIKNALDSIFAYINEN
jgi:hypothetical protein